MASRPGPERAWQMTEAITHPTWIHVVVLLCLLTAAVGAAAWSFLRNLDELMPEVRCKKCNIKAVLINGEPPPSWQELPDGWRCEDCYAREILNAVDAEWERRRQMGQPLCCRPVRALQNRRAL